MRDSRTNYGRFLDNKFEVLNRQFNDVMKQIDNGIINCEPILEQVELAPYHINVLRRLGYSVCVTTKGGDFLLKGSTDAAEKHITNPAFITDVKTFTCRVIVPPTGGFPTKEDLQLISELRRTLQERCKAEAKMFYDTLEESELVFRKEMMNAAIAGYPLCLVRIRKDRRKALNAIIEKLKTEKFSVSEKEVANSHKIHDTISITIKWGEKEIDGI